MYTPFIVLSSWGRIPVECIAYNSKMIRVIVYCAVHSEIVFISYFICHLLLFINFFVYNLFFYTSFISVRR